VNPRGLLVVIDTNVWISGLLTRAGAPALLTRRVVRYGQPVFSADTFEELKERLWRPKFDRYVTMERRKALLTDLDSISHRTQVPREIAERTFCRDAADDKFIHVALASKAAWLVTGDEDLLVLAEGLSSHRVTVLSPARALDLPEFSAEA
jgi:putative PIN family toxin of toxin-antitoxin system